MQRPTATPSQDPQVGPTGPVMRATPPGNLRVHDQDEGLRATRDDPQGSRFQTQGPIHNEVAFPEADASYDGYGAYAALDGSRVDTAEFADLEAVGPLTSADQQTARTDVSIHVEVCERIADDPTINSAGIQVAVERGEVYLQGSVARRSLKRLAEDLAYRVEGVLDVHNRLRVSTTNLVKPKLEG